MSSSEVLKPAPQNMNEKEIRTHKTTIRLALTELALIESRALKQGMTISEYMRQMSLTGNIKLPPQRPEINLRTYQELGKIGVNINQYLRAINSGQSQHIPPETITQLSELIHQIRTQIWQQD